MLWIFAACLAISLAATGPARASMIWGPVDTISGDSDVSDAGTLLDAIDFNTATTVNGVDFTGIPTSNDIVSGNFTFSSVTAYAQNDSGDASYTTPPFGNLSSDYRAMLGASPLFLNSPLTLTMSGLVSGATYQFEFWSDNYAVGGYDDAVTASDGTSAVVDSNTASAVGGLGQFVIGAFTANTTGTETVSFTGNYETIVYLNAAELRQLTPALSGTTQIWNPRGDFTGGNGTWDTGVTPNWDSAALWTDGNNALFTGTGGVVTVVTPTANALAFSASGSYLLTGGTLTMSGSNITVNSNAEIDSNIDATAAGLYVNGGALLTLTGSDTLGGQDLVIDTGAVGITGGGTVSGVNGWIGYNPATTGAVTVDGAGSSWSNSGTLYVGESGSGSLSITNGAVVSSSNGGIIGDQTGSIGTVIVSGSGGASSWTDGGDLYVGNSGSGSLMISNGASVTSTENNIGAAIGYNAGSNGLVTVDGTGSNWTDNGSLYIGFSGTGSLMISSGGAVSDGYSRIGNSAGGVGVVTVDGSGSSWTDSEDLYIGLSGTGSLMISNGGSVTSGYSGAGAVIGYQAGSKGLVTVDGTGSNWTANSGLYVGDSATGSGSLMISSGGAVSDYFSDIGLSAGMGVVTVDGSGSSWSNSETLSIGESGSGSLSITNGALVSSSNGGIIGDQTGSIGTVMVSGSGGASSWTDGGDLYIGNAGAGSLMISNGASVTNGQNNVGASIGNNAGSNGLVTVDGTGSNWTDDGDLYIGQSGSGSLMISKGGSVISGQISFGAVIGYNAGSNGLVTMDGTGSNWTDDGDLYIGDSGTGSLMISKGASVTNGQKNVGAIIGNNAGSNGLVTVDGTGSNWTDNGNLYIGDSGSGSLSITNGASVSSSSGWIAYSGSGIGMVTVDGSGSTWTNSQELYVGESGSGSLSISNGASVSSSNGGVIGDQTGSTGMVTVSGSGGASTWTIGSDFFVGGSGSGALAISNGGVVSSGYNNVGSVIGYSAGSSGTVTVNGSGSTWNAGYYPYVGYSGTGTLTVSNGGAVITVGFLTIGQNSNSSGSVSVTGSGSTLIADENIYAGISGTGTLTISGGAAATAADGVYIASDPNSSGSVMVEGAGSMLASVGIYVGGEGSGSLLISGGATVSGSGYFQGEIGFDPGGAGTATVTGSGSMWTGDSNMMIGCDETATGTLTISSGGLVSDSNGWIGDAAGAWGLVTVTGSGSAWTNSGNLAIGGPGFGALEMTDGGLVSVTGTTTVGPSGALLFDGSSTLDTGSLVVNGGALYTLGAGTFSNSATVATGGMSVNTEGYDATFSGDFSGPGRIVKYGGGALTLTGSSSIGRNLFIAGFGEVQISGSGFFSDSSGVIGAGGANTLVVTGSGSQWTNTYELYVGYSGTGALAVTGGGAVVTDSNTYLGYGANTSGAVAVTGAGSTWSNTGLLTIGGSGAGSLTITGAGSGTSNGTSYIGRDAGSLGLVRISGSGSTWTTTGNLAVGFSAPGKLTVIGGGVVNSEGVDYIGFNAGSNGTVDVSGTGSAWSNSGVLVVGEGGQGLLSISSGGSASSGGNSYIGLDTGSSGAVDVSGSGSTFTASGNLAVGRSGTGALAITGGGVAHSEEGSYIGLNAGSSGGVTVSGSGSQWTTSLNLAVGYSGTGTLLVNSGGEAISEGNDFIGYNAGSEGIVKVSGSGSSWSNAQELVIGSLGTGTLIDVNGGQLSVTGETLIGSAGALEFDGLSTFATGSLVVNGGALETLGAATFTPSVGLGASGVTINTGGFNSTFSGAFRGSGGLTKVGSGTATLTGSSTYTGATAVNSGALALTTGSAQTASLGNTAITVKSGATLSATRGPSPFSNLITAGTLGSGAAGATLTLDPGSTFSMAGNSLAGFFLHQEISFSGPAFTIGGASGIAPSLIFDIGNASAGTDLLHVNSTVSVLATGGDITIDPLAGDTSLTAGNYDLIVAAGGFSGTNGNGLTLSGTTLALSGATYDLSLAESTTNTEILTVSASTPSAPTDMLGNTSASPAMAASGLSTPGGLISPAIGTAAVPEPENWASGIAALASLGLLFRRSRGRKRLPK